MARTIKTACGTYTKDELIRIASFASTADELNAAEDLIEAIGDDLPKAWKEEIEMELFLSWDSYFADDFAKCYGAEDRDYSPSAPWNAPGMKVSDFI